MEEVFRAQTKDDILQSYITGQDFMSSIDAAGYNFYVRYTRYQNSFTAAQLKKFRFIFNGLVPDNVKGYTLVLTNKLFSISSVRQRPPDLI